MSQSWIKPVRCRVVLARLQCLGKGLLVRHFVDGVLLQLGPLADHLQGAVEDLGEPAAVVAQPLDTDGGTLAATRLSRCSSSCMRSVSATERMGGTWLSTSRIGVAAALPACATSLTPSGVAHRRGRSDSR